ncbi:MAG TPA: SRPBCC family protein [Nocardioides sp.]|nr:SRPBCC family protein [Nocardioides sp.]
MPDVRFDVPPDVAFDYLVDPHRRPEWQSSLRRVEDVDPGDPRVGQRWIDVTLPGLRPRMQTTALERPRTWTEVGTWRGINAVLTLEFRPDGDGCRVTPSFRVTGRGALRPLARAVDRVAVLAVLPDLRRAARLLAARSR